MALIVVVTLFGSMIAVSAGVSVENKDTNSVNGLLKSNSIDISKENTTVSILGGKIKVKIGPVTYSSGGSALLGMTTAKVKIGLLTSKYRQIDYILINGKRAYFRSSGYNNGYSPVGSISFGSESYNISDLSFKKRNDGYYYDISKEVSLYELNNIQIVYKNQADLKINKISKKGQYRIVTIKNVGDAQSSANKLGVYNGKKLITKLSVKPIKPGKTGVYKVKIPTKYAKSSKNFKVDYQNKVNEIYENNNVKKAK